MADLIHHDDRVLACVDQSHFAEIVADYAVWAASGLQLPLEFLHVLDRHQETAIRNDHSGTLGVEPQAALMEQLVSAEAERSKAAREAGRVFLAGLRDRAMQRGIAEPSMRQRYGSLEETLVEQEPGVELFVLGRRGEAAENTGRDLGRNLERMVRALHKPILAVSEAFRTPTRALLAFDGSAVTRRGVELVAASRLLGPLHIDLVMSGTISRSGREQLQRAGAKLKEANVSVDVIELPGDPDREIAEAIRTRESDLLIMGAYGHSVFRRLFLGSRTADLLRASVVPTLLLR